MSPLVDLALRVTLVLLLALGTAWLLRRQSAARRHAVLAAGLAGSLIVMPLAWLVPAWSPLPLPRITDDRALLLESSEPIEIVTGPRAFAVEDVAALAWSGGSALLAAWLLVRIVRIGRQARAATPADPRWAQMLDVARTALGVRRRVELRVSRAIDTPAVCGWWRPVVLLPAGSEAWAPARMRIVLLHELAHLARGDWPVLVVGELAWALYWWHPLAWLVRARARRESEHACDDLVLAAGVVATDYGAELVQLARLGTHASRPLVAGMAHPSSLERRITAMIDRTRDRRPLTPRTSAVCTAALLLAVGPIAAFSLRAQEPGQGLVVQVFDTTGAVLPGVGVELASEATGARRSTTEGSGRVTFTDVAAGEYTISATLQGFRTLTAPLVVSSARDRQRSITLQVGEIEEVVTVRERRPTSPPTASGSVVEPPRVGGNIKVPRKLRHVSPEYPPAMRDAGLEGIVPMEALIARDGSVASVRVISADVHPEFARAAADAVHQWVFSPTLLNGEAIEVRMRVSVRFSLQD